MASALAGSVYRYWLVPRSLLAAAPLQLQIAGDVVRLRALVATDADLVYRACLDPQIKRFTTFPEPTDIAETRAWIQSQEYLRSRGAAIDFGIVPVGGVVIVGAIGLTSIDLEERHAEIGYWIAPKMRGRGFATAALQLLSSWAFGRPLELHRIYIYADVANTASRRAAERAGFTFEEELPAHISAKGRRWDVARYSLASPRADDAQPGS